MQRVRCPAKQECVTKKTGGCIRAVCVGEGWYYFVHYSDSEPCLLLFAALATMSLQTIMYSTIVMSCMVLSGFQTILQYSCILFFVIH